MKRNDDIKRVIDYFRAREEVTALYLFGSAAKGTQSEESDLDIAVLVNEKKLRVKSLDIIRRDYYAASPRLSLRNVDIVILNTAPPYLKHRIIKTGTLLFDKNRKLRVRFVTNAILEYLDFKPIEDIFTGAVASRFRRGTVGR